MTMPNKMILVHTTEEQNNLKGKINQRFRNWTSYQTSVYVLPSQDLLIQLLVKARLNQWPHKHILYIF